MKGDRLKCIGGVLDGTHVTLEQGKPDYSFYEREPMKQVELGADDALVATEVVAIRHTYTRRKMAFGKGASALMGEWSYIEYLAPIEWTDYQAVKHQFGK